MSETPTNRQRLNFLAAAANAKSNVAASLEKAMGAMSQRELGLTAGVDQRRLEEQLNQKNAIGVDNLARIALVLGLKPWDNTSPGRSSK